jgi:hypothetical protein
MVETLREDACQKVGSLGTTARAVVGTLMLVTVLDGPRVVDGVQLWAWPVALIGFPGMLLVLQWLRSRRGGPPLRATGLIGHAINVLILLALYGTTWYAPQLSVLSDATVIFYGCSMLLAAARGYAGCEVLAVSNWVLRRDDQVGCVFFWPVDELESRMSR